MPTITEEQLHDGSHVAVVQYQIARQESEKYCTMMPVVFEPVPANLTMKDFMDNKFNQVAGKVGKFFKKYDHLNTDKEPHKYYAFYAQIIPKEQQFDFEDCLVRIKYVYVNKFNNNEPIKVKVTTTSLPRNFKPDDLEGLHIPLSYFPDKTTSETSYLDPDCPKESKIVRHALKAVVTSGDVPYDWEQHMVCYGYQSF